MYIICRTHSLAALTFFLCCQPFAKEFNIRKNHEPTPHWLLATQREGPVEFNGVSDMDSAGLGANSILYPGANAAGFLAAVFTHAAVTNSMKEHQRKEIQTKADEVLVEYRPLLQSFETSELMTLAVSLMSVTGSKDIVGAISADLASIPKDSWLLLSDPIFYMTQDQQAIVLNTYVTLYAPDRRDTHTYQNYIRVVSLPANTDDAISYWSANDGALLKNKSAELLAKAFDIAITNANDELGIATTKNATFRYLQGTTQKIERAQLLHEDCIYMLLKTLRGHLYLVPKDETTLNQTTTPFSCGPDSTTNYRKPS